MTAVSAAVPARAKFEFRWKCSFMGTIDYEVFGDGETYRIGVRRSASDYERSIFNGGDQEWQRDVVSAIDLVRRSSSPSQPLSPETVAAFNAWLLAEHEASIAKMKAKPERYGFLAEDDPLLRAPRPVIGARYEVGSGWIRNPA
jgi:hypothetical protein